MKLWFPLTMAGSVAAGSAGTYVAVNPDAVKMFEEKVSREEAVHECMASLRAEVVGPPDSPFLTLMAGTMVGWAEPMVEQKLQEARDEGLSWKEIRDRCRSLRLEAWKSRDGAD